RMRLHEFSPSADAPHPERVLVDLQEHLFGQVVATGDPLVFDDLNASDPLAADPELAARGFVSCILLPLISSDRPLGVIGFFRSRREPFAQEQVDLLLEVAEQAAIAVGRARLYAVEKKRSRQLAIINEVARAALGTFDIDALLHQTAQLIQQHFAYYDVSLFTVDGATHEVVLAAQAGSYDAESVIGYRQPIGVGMVGWTAKTGKTRMASDVGLDAEYHLAFPEEQLSRSELCVPIRIAGATAGVINIECPQVGAFDETDVTAIETLADQIAQAIASSHIYEEVAHLKDLDENILASIPSAIAVVDDELNIQAVNDATCAAVGVARADLVAGHFHDFFHFHVLDPARIRQTVSRVIDHDEVASFPAARITLGTGDERIVDLTIRPVTRTGDRHALIFFNDITERRRAQEEVLRERQKLSDIVSAMGAGLALIDPDHTIRWSNSTLERWFNGGESLVGHTCHEICRLEESPCPDCPVAGALETGETHRTNQPMLVQHETRHYENVFAPICDAAGKVVQIIRLTFDVTEHVHRVNQLSLLQKLSQAMQGALDLDRLLRLVLTCVTAGPGLGFNRALLLLLNGEGDLLEGRLAVGPASGEEASRIWHDLAMHPLTLGEHMLHLVDQPQDGADASMQAIARQIRVPLSDTTHVLIRTIMDRTPIVVADAISDPAVPEGLNSLLRAPQFVSVPLLAHGRPLGVLVADNIYTGQAITEDQVEMLQTFASHAGAAIAAASAYRRLAEQFQQLEDAQDRLVRAERLATVGRLAAHVAHEIRNPLVTIGGFARSILRDPARLDRVERNAQIILDEVERLEQILANVMNFSKPGNPILRERDLNELIEAVCSFHENLLAERGVELVKNLSPDCPILRFDPDQIRQVFINLVQNAIDSMPSGGTLTIATRSDGSYAIASVADTGQGMDEDVLDNLFQPFYTTKVGGTGLGLSVSHKIIHDHGGDITVRSEPDVGSTFTVTLPLPDNSKPEERS
ncbi:GAF domain-containing protein, partial [bacterium]|nr:GAF domain-containing protein [bacterium]